MISLGFAPGLTSPVVDARKNYLAYLIYFLEDPRQQVQLVQCKYFSNWHIQILYIAPIYEWKKFHIEEQFGTQLDLIWSFANTPFLKFFIIFKQGSDSPSGLISGNKVVLVSLAQMTVMTASMRSNAT